jgi:Arginase/agmatinase/formimionoglutamate hydrolase, arginase family
MECGLAECLQPDHIIELPVPLYSPDAESNTRIRNGHAIREYNLKLAEIVAAAHALASFPLVIGGDCSILLGALAGSRRAGLVSLVHIDGHSDFRHPGNYDASQMPGAVAGMDLALATGRGEPLLTQWPHISGPLVADNEVLQLGERESHDVDYAWPDIAQTAIHQIDVFTAQAAGCDEILSKINGMLNRSRQRFWVHFDVDVFDQALMPAVDSPGSPGISPQWLESICAQLLNNPLCCGMTVTVYDPELDADRTCAELIIEFLSTLFRPSCA